MAVAVSPQGISGLGQRDIARTEDLQLQLLGLNRLGGQRVLRLRVGTKALTPWNIGCPNATVVVRNPRTHEILAHQAVSVWGAFNCTEDVELPLPPQANLSRPVQFELYGGLHERAAVEGGSAGEPIVRQLQLEQAIEETDQTGEESWAQWIGGEVGQTGAEILRPLALPLGIAVGGALLVTNVDEVIDTISNLTS